MGNRAPCQTIRPRRHVVYPRYASYGNVFVATNRSWPRKEEKKKKREEKRKKKAAAARWPVKVGQGRGEPRSLGRRRRGGGEGAVLRSGTTDVIFIPGPGRGQRGHRRTGDE